MDISFVPFLGFCKEFILTLDLLEVGLKNPSLYQMDMESFLFLWFCKDL